MNNTHYDRQREKFRSERAGRVPGIKEKPMNRPLWQDLNAYFKELFQEHPDLQVRTYTPQALMHDLQVWFDGKYTLEDIQKMCEMGYPEMEKGMYEFKRGDFIKEVSHG